jgi:hypothetical protein
LGENSIIQGDAMRCLLSLTFCILVLATVATACGPVEIGPPAPDREHPNGSGGGGGNGM